MTMHQNDIARYRAHGFGNAAARPSRYAELNVACFLRSEKTANNSSRTLDSIFARPTNEGRSAASKNAVNLYDMVVLRADTAYGDVVYRQGTAGAIVHIYEEQGAYEVEFSDPEPGVLTLRSFDIVPL